MTESIIGDSWTAMALELVRAERNHQIDRGFDAEHDDAHEGGDLMLAGQAMLYRDQAQRLRDGPLQAKSELTWPWPIDEMPKQCGGNQDLIIAIALLVSELERRLRDV